MNSQEEAEHRGKIAALWHYVQVKFDRYGYDRIEPAVKLMLVEDWYQALCLFYPDEIRAAIPRWKGRKAPSETDARDLCLEARRKLKPVPRLAQTPKPRPEPEVMEAVEKIEKTVVAALKPEPEKTDRQTEEEFQEQKNDMLRELHREGML